MDNLVALVIFLFIQEAIRRWNSRALSLLSVEDRLKVLDDSSKVSIYERAPLPILLLGFAGLIYLNPSTFVMSIGLTVFVVLLAISTFISRRISHKRLCALGMPESYTKQQRLADLKTSAWRCSLSGCLDPTSGSSKVSPPCVTQP